MKIFRLTNATVNLARSLTPSYMRLAGSDSNKFIFQSNPNSNHSESNLGKQKAKSVSSKYLPYSNTINLNQANSRTIFFFQRCRMATNERILRQNRNERNCMCER